MCFTGVSVVSKVLLMYQRCFLRDPEVLYLFLMYQRCIWCTWSLCEVFRDVMVVLRLCYASVWCQRCLMYSCMLYQWCYTVNKCLNVRSGSTLSDLFTPCSYGPSILELQELQVYLGAVKANFTVSHRSGKYLHPTHRLCHHLGSSGRRSGLQQGPDSPGSPRLVEFCGMGSYYPRKSHYKLCSEYYEGEGDRCPGNAMGKCPGGPSPVSAKGYSHSGGQPNCGKVQPEWIWWSGHH